MLRTAGVKKTFIALVSLLAGAASAQSAPTIDVEQLWPDPAGLGSLFVGNGRTLGRGEFRTGVAVFYTRGNLRSLGGAGSNELLQDRLGFQLFGAIGLFPWLELGANVPVIAYQEGAAALRLAQAGLGNPWLHAKVSLLDEREPWAVSVLLGVGVPVGSAQAQGNGGLSLSPRLQVGHTFERWQLGLELGYLHRATVDFSGLTGVRGDRVGGQVALAAMITSVNEAGPRGELAVRAFVPTEGAPPGLEAQLGLRWPLGPVELVGSAGPGFGGTLTTPSVRAFLGVAFANTRPRPPLATRAP